MPEEEASGSSPSTPSRRFVSSTSLTPLSIGHVKVKDGRLPQAGNRVIELGVNATLVPLVAPVASTASPTASSTQAELFSKDTTFPTSPMAASGLTHAVATAHVAIDSGQPAAPASSPALLFSRESKRPPSPRAPADASYRHRRARRPAPTTPPAIPRSPRAVPRLDQDADPLTAAAAAAARESAATARTVEAVCELSWML